MSARKKYGPLLNISEWPSGTGRRWGTCPLCGTRAQLDPEQYRGEISVICPGPVKECGYHETHDYREAG